MKLNLSQWYKLLAPRPVVLVSTKNAKGVSNAAPFSFVMPCSLQPPLLAFASAPGHDTAKNILETKDFVVNIPGRGMLNQLWICAEEFPSNVSEIEKAGLTEEKAEKTKSPRIKECAAHFECKLFSHHDAGDHMIIVGRILHAEVKEDLMKNGKYLIKNANPLMHIGAEEFGLLGDIVKAK